MKSIYTEIGNIFIDKVANYQPYSDNEPYFVGYADLDDDILPPEGLVYAVCNTKEEAAEIEKDLIKAAEEYNKSLLSEVYTFTEYLEVR